MSETEGHVDIMSQIATIVGIVMGVVAIILVIAAFIGSEL